LFRLIKCEAFAIILFKEKDIHNPLSFGEGWGEA
jgi:hypothetical protein